MIVEMEQQDNQLTALPTSSAQSLKQKDKEFGLFIFGNIAADSRVIMIPFQILNVNGQEFNGDGTESEFGVTYPCED